MKSACASADRSPSRRALRAASQSATALTAAAPLNRPTDRRDGFGTKIRSAGADGRVFSGDLNLRLSARTEQALHAQLPEQAQRRSEDVDDVLEAERLGRSARTRQRLQSDLDVGLPGLQKTNQQLGDEQRAVRAH